MEEKVTTLEICFRASKKCRCVEALRVDLQVYIDGVGIYMRSSRRRSAAVVIKGG
jgi:hypothetical protein